MEKMNHAASAQWLVFHTTPEDMHDLEFRKLVLEAIKARKMQKS
jgi:hypothetical protein